MNDSHIISLPVAADLSATQHVAVKLTSTGINVATAVSDRIIGTCVHPNLPAAFGESVVGRAATVKLSAGNGLHFIQLGAGTTTAIAMGDELQLDTTDGTFSLRTTGPLAGIAVDAAPSSSATGVIRAILFPPDQGIAGAAGVDVTQITSASTGVTASGYSGVITTVALTTAAAAEERFTVTNTKVGVRDVVALSTTYNGAGTPMLSVVKMAAGAFDIVVTNAHASAALDAVMLINYAVIKTAI